MSAQTTYRFATQPGMAGGIIDLAPYAIDTFLNEEDNGVMKPGLGVVTGELAGKGVALPDKKDLTAPARFEGIVTNNHTREYDLEGKVYLRHGVSMGVMRYGRIWARAATQEGNVTDAIEYGQPVYIVAKQDDPDLGCVTNKKDENIEVKGMFLGPVDNGLVGVELFNPNAEIKGTET